MKPIIILLCVLISGPAYADIISTDVRVGMMTSYYNSPTMITDGFAIDSGVTSAGVNVTGSATGMTAYSYLNLTNLSPTSATLNFDLGMKANGFTGEGYLGAAQYSGQSYFANLAHIYYSKTVETPIWASWNFAYSGSNPFGVGMVWVLTDKLGIPDFVSLQAGDPWGSHPYSGTQILNVDPYAHDLYVYLWPNLGGGIGGTDGRIKGSMNLNFGDPPVDPPPTTVPETSTLILLGIGLVGLLAFSLKK